MVFSSETLSQDPHECMKWTPLIHSYYSYIYVTKLMNKGIIPTSKGQSICKAVEAKRK